MRSSSGPPRPPLNPGSRPPFPPRQFLPVRHIDGDPKLRQFTVHRPRSVSRDVPNMRYHHPPHPGQTIFFTVVTADRSPILIDEIDRLRGAFRQVMQRQPFAIDAIVVLPDHLHTIWRLPEGDGSYATRWSVLKRYFSVGIARADVRSSLRRRRERGVWQRRFWEHVVRDESEWNAYVDYIHYNPVKHGYCTAPGDWEFSSYRRFAARGQGTEGWEARLAAAADALQGQVGE